MKKIIFITLLLAGIIFLASCGKKDSFVEEYDLPKDHVMVEKTPEEIFAAAENKEHFILMFGFSSCAYCQAFVPIINEVADELDFEIWYWDPKEDRADLTEDYLKMLDLVGLQRPTSENREDQSVGYDRISVPFVSIINYGKVDYFPDNAWPTTFPDGKVVNDGYSKVEVDGELKVLATYMWDDLLYTKEEIKTEEVQNELKDTLKRLLFYSKCGSCDA